MNRVGSEALSKLKPTYPLQDKSFAFDHRCTFQRDQGDVANLHHLFSSWTLISAPSLICAVNIHSHLKPYPKERFT